MIEMKTVMIGRGTLNPTTMSVTVLSAMAGGIPSPVGAPLVKPPRGNVGHGRPVAVIDVEPAWVLEEDGVVAVAQDRRRTDTTFAARA